MKEQGFQFTDLIFLDVETTGLLHHFESRIVEIGLSLWDSSGHRLRTSSLIDPQEPIPDMYTKIHGIDDALVRGAPTFNEFWQTHMDLFTGRTVVAHNLSFDMGMLNRELARIDSPPLGNSGIDTVPILRKLLPDQKNHKLQSLAENLGVTHERRHRAGDDVFALEQILSIAMSGTPTVLTGPIGIDFAMWGGIASHRYFRDPIHWSQKTESEIDVVMTSPQWTDSGAGHRLEKVRLEKPASSGKRFGEFREKGKYPLSLNAIYRIQSV